MVNLKLDNTIFAFWFIKRISGSSYWDALSELVKLYNSLNVLESELGGATFPLEAGLGLMICAGRLAFAAAASCTDNTLGENV